MLDRVGRTHQGGVTDAITPGDAAAKVTVPIVYNHVDIAGSSSLMLEPRVQEGVDRCDVWVVAQSRSPTRANVTRLSVLAVSRWFRTFGLCEYVQVHTSAKRGLPEWARPRRARRARLHACTLACLLACTRRHAGGGDWPTDAHAKVPPARARLGTCRRGLLSRVFWAALPRRV